MSNEIGELQAVLIGEGHFAAKDRQVLNSLADQQEDINMSRITLTRRKAPAFGRIQKLNLRPNPEVRTLLVKAGVVVQRRLEKRERTAKPLENVLRAIVR